MIDILIISGVMLTSPLWVVAYDYIDGHYTNEEEEQDEIDTQTWGF